MQQAMAGLCETPYGRALMIARINLQNSLRWYAMGAGKLASEFLRTSDHFHTLANTRRPLGRDYMADIANVDALLTGGSL